MLWYVKSTSLDVIAFTSTSETKMHHFVNFQWQREAKMAIFKLSSILKNSSALGSFTCIFENNSLKALFGKIWRNWKFWNCCRIFDIYRNWLLNTLKENGGLILKQKQNARRSIPASVMTVMAVSPRFSYFWKTSNVWEYHEYHGMSWNTFSP